MITRGQKNQNSINLFLNNYFNIIILLVAIIFLTVAYLIVVKPKYDETMASIQANIERQQKLYGDQQKKLNSLKTISELYSKISPTDLKKFNGVLPDEYVKEKLFGELEEIITANGFVLNSVKISKDGDNAGDEKNEEQSVATSSDPKLGELRIDISVSAVSYSGFKNLLKLLETNLRLFDITKLSFSPGGNSASLTLSTYYYKK